MQIKLYELGNEHGDWHASCHISNTHVERKKNRWTTKLWLKKIAGNQELLTLEARKLINSHFRNKSR